MSFLKWEVHQIFQNYKEGLGSLLLCLLILKELWQYSRETPEPPSLLKCCVTSADATKSYIRCAFVCGKVNDGQVRGLSQDARRAQKYDLWWGECYQTVSSGPMLDSITSLLYTFYGPLSSLSPRGPQVDQG